MVNLDIGPYTLLIPIMLTGFALSFVFVPLATMTTATLPGRDGQRHGALQHAAQYRRIHRHCDGDDGSDPPRRSAPDRNRREPDPIERGVPAEIGGNDAPISAITSGRAQAGPARWD